MQPSGFNFFGSFIANEIGTLLIRNLRIRARAEVMDQKVLQLQVAFDSPFGMAMF